MDWFHKGNTDWNINRIFLVLIDDKPVSMRSTYPCPDLYIHQEGCFSGWGGRHFNDDLSTI